MGIKKSQRNTQKGISIFRTGGARPPTEEMIHFIDENREDYGVESICKVIPIAPSFYYEMKSREKDPTKAPARLPL